MARGKKPEQSQIEAACARYVKGEHPRIIASSTGIAYDTLMKYVKQAGVDGRYFCRKRIGPETARLILELYSSGNSSPAISKKVGLSIPTVLKYIRSSGGTVKTFSESKRVYTCNHDYFSVIDTNEKAYLLGFITADGSVSETKNSLTISLSRKDKGHLVKIATLLSSDHPIRDTVEVLGGKPHQKAILTITSPTMVRDLCSLGVVPNKTEFLTLPALDANLWSHYVRGYFDGDGCITIAKSSYVKLDGTRSSGIVFGLVGLASFVAELQHLLVRHCELNYVSVTRPRNCKPYVGRLRYSGSHQVRRICKWIYRDSTIHLERKMVKALSFYEIGLEGSNWPFTSSTTSGLPDHPGA